ncbi:MAG: M48 family metalloprotease [Rhodothermaceae bacterium]|nr:M48 family metalloprotease [Rhodothermaceae bacterium]
MLHNPILEAVGAVLVHSLWQGALVGVGLYVALKVFKFAGSSARYAFCCAAMVLLFLLPVSTGVQIYKTNQSGPDVYPITEELPLVSPAPIIESVPIEGEITTEALASPPAPQHPVEEAYASTLSWRPYVVGLWIIGVIVLSVRWMGGLIGVYRLRRRGLAVENDVIQSVFDTLVERLGIKSSVRLLATVHVDQPMVIGWLKPVVLLPVSILTNLSPAHVEAILAHELVHVRRHDYLILVLQLVMEIVFFYHPVVWWVSRQMRVEREYACDDLVTKALGNDLDYVAALAKLDSGRVGKWVLGANDGRLVDRIRRIVRRKVEGSQPSKFSWFGVVVLLFGCGLLITACMNWSEPDLDGTSEELFDRAVEKVKEENFTAARPYAEQAAQQGDMCSMWLLAHMYYPNKGRVHYRNGRRASYVKWGPQSEETSKEWAEAFLQALNDEGEAGNTEAMLFLHMAHRTTARRGPFKYITSKNDSLSEMWLERAYLMDHPYATRQKAIKAIREHGDREEGERLFRKAIELGDEEAYEAWSRVVTDPQDPGETFAIIDLAIRNKAEGAHEWISEFMETIDEQVALGNQATIPWKEMADSLRISERLSELPEPEEGRKNTLSRSLTLCKHQDQSLFIKKPRRSWFGRNKAEEESEVMGVTW